MTNKMENVTPQTTKKCVPEQKVYHGRLPNHSLQSSPAFSQMHAGLTSTEDERLLFTEKLKDRLFF